MSDDLKMVRELHLEDYSSNYVRECFIYATLLQARVENSNMKNLFDPNLMGQLFAFVAVKYCLERDLPHTDVNLTTFPELGGLSEETNRIYKAGKTFYMPYDSPIAVKVYMKACELYYQSSGTKVDPKMIKAEAFSVAFGGPSFRRLRSGRHYYCIKNNVIWQLVPEETTAFVATMEASRASASTSAIAGLVSDCFWWTPGMFLQSNYIFGRPLSRPRMFPHPNVRGFTARGERAGLRGQGASDVRGAQARMAIGSDHDSAITSATDEHPRPADSSRPNDYYASFLDLLNGDQRRTINEPGFDEMRDATSTFDRGMSENELLRLTTQLGLNPNGIYNWSTRRNSPFSRIAATYEGTSGGPSTLGANSLWNPSPPSRFNHTLYGGGGVGGVSSGNGVPRETLFGPPTMSHDNHFLPPYYLGSPDYETFTIHETPRPFENATNTGFLGQNNFWGNRWNITPLVTPYTGGQPAGGSTSRMADIGGSAAPTLHPVNSLDAHFGDGRTNDGPDLPGLFPTSFPEIDNGLYNLLEVHVSQARTFVRQVITTLSGGTTFIDTEDPEDISALFERLFPNNDDVFVGPVVIPNVRRCLKPVKTPAEMADIALKTECSVCHEYFIDLALEENHEVVGTVCGHVFCKGCIESWFDAERTIPVTCPLCREPITEEELIKVDLKE